MDQAKFAAGQDLERRVEKAEQTQELEHQE
jgi:hypothetical protein